jgi:hypothetical protein
MSNTNQQQATTIRPAVKVVGNKRAKQRKDAGQPGGPAFEPNAAGIDIGAREIYVAIPAERDGHAVRKCETFTSDLHQMAE